MTEATAAPGTIRVFLLDDHEVVRRGLRALLESAGDITVVGEAGSVAEGVPAILAARPDVAVLDARLPDGSGVEVCRDVRSAAPEIKALMLTSYDDDDAMMSAIVAGAAGYVLKQIDGDSLLSGVRLVAGGQSLIDPVVASRVVERMRAQDEGPAEADELAGMTDQERKILELLAKGMTNREIGAELFLAEKTVKNYVTRILAKLGVSRRTQAALLATKLMDGK